MKVEESVSYEVICEMRREAISQICLKMQKRVSETLVVMSDVWGDVWDAVVNVCGYGIYEEKVDLGPINLFGWWVFKRTHHRQLCYLDTGGSMSRISFTIDDKRFYSVVLSEAETLAEKFRAITGKEVLVEITRKYI